VRQPVIPTTKYMTVTTGWKYLKALFQVVDDHLQVLRNDGRWDRTGGVQTKTDFNFVPMERKELAILRAARVRTQQDS
jgi:hypothetical protein